MFVAGWTLFFEQDCHIIIRFEITAQVLEDIVPELAHVFSDSIFDVSVDQLGQFPVHMFWYF